MISSHFKFFFIFLTALFYPIFAFAVDVTPISNHKIKFVFPFGLAQPKVCDINYRTMDGCCVPPDTVYTLDQHAACCRSPNMPLTAGTNTHCCTPAATNQSRWGQTQTSPCGQLCTLPNEVFSSFGTSSCCAACSEVIAFQSSDNICGTCCSRIPESCGSAGTRVCEPATGSAYCSQTSDCSHPDEWLIGSDGEGGYTCCTSCTGTRYHHTTSTCGDCCAGTSQTVTYHNMTSCCPSIGFNQVRTGQTTSNVCGSVCTKPFCFNICTP